MPEEDVRRVQMLLKGVMRESWGFNPQEVSNVLWAFATLAVKGVNVDANVLQKVSKQVERTSDKMDCQQVVMSLWAIAKLGSLGADVDHRAVLDLNIDAKRVRMEMTGQEFSTSLWAWAKLKELNIKPGVIRISKVRYVSWEAQRVVHILKPQEVATALWAWGTLSSRMILCDPNIYKMVTDRIKRSPGELDSRQLSNSLWALSKIAQSGVEYEERYSRGASVHQWIDMEAVKALSEEVSSPKCAEAMNGRDISKTLWALANFAESGWDEVNLEQVRKISRQLPRVSSAMAGEDVTDAAWALATLWARSRLGDRGLYKVECVASDAAVESLTNRAEEVFFLMRDFDQSRTKWALQIINGGSIEGHWAQIFDVGSKNILPLIPRLRRSHQEILKTNVKYGRKPPGKRERPYRISGPKSLRYGRSAQGIKNFGFFPTTGATNEGSLSVRGKYLQEVNSNTYSKIPQQGGRGNKTRTGIYGSKRSKRVNEP